MASILACLTSATSHSPGVGLLDSRVGGWEAAGGRWLSLGFPAQECGPQVGESLCSTPPICRHLGQSRWRPLLFLSIDQIVPVSPAAPLALLSKVSPGTQVPPTLAWSLDQRQGRWPILE